MTQVSISGTDIVLDGRPTYPGREFDGHRIEGMLFNVRAVQAIFDDANPETRDLWRYPDTGEWDPDRNTDDLCAALPTWRDHGVLALTVSFQGGGPLYAPEVYDHFDNNGFTAEGEIKPAYAERMRRLLDRIDELGMVAIVSLFYGPHLRKLNGDEAIRRAAHAGLEFLEETGHRNVLVEVANEFEICHRQSGSDLFLKERAHELVMDLRGAHPQFLFSTSQVGAKADTGRGMPTTELVDSVDYVLLHGNGNLSEQLATAMTTVQQMPVYQLSPKPIIINEDSTGIPNLEVAWRHRVSWGYYDQGFGGPRGWGGDPYFDHRAQPRESRYEDLSGFQTPPVNWTINTEQKRAFFGRVAEITGYAADAKS